MRPLKSQATTVDVETRGELHITAEKLSALIDHLVTIAKGQMEQRIDDGRDADGNPFAPYSDTYAKQLAAIGQGSEVDFNVTGEFRRNLVTERAREVHDLVASFELGPRSTTSAEVRLPPPWIVNHPDALAKWGTKFGGRASRTGKRSPAHNRIAYWHQAGAGNLPVRKLIGLTPADRKLIADEIRAFGLFQAGGVGRPRK